MTVRNSLIRVPVELVTAAAATVLKAYGTPPDHADLVIDNLVGADRLGIHTHGVARVQMYAGGLDSGSIDPSATAALEYGAPAASCWDARHGFGQVAMATLVDHACVGAKRGRFPHRGRAWLEPLRIRGSLGPLGGGPRPGGHGIHDRRTTGHPDRRVRPELGTNPLAFAMRSKRDEIVVDMSTSTVAMGKLELAHRSDAAIPIGWALDGDGEPLTHPAPLLEGMLTGRAGGLLPLGGSGTEHGGHKGYGLGLLVEVLCTVLSGGSDLRVDKDGHDRTTGHVSHSVIAMDPAHLGGVEPAQRALDRLLGALRESPAHDPVQPVKIPGDPERDWAERVGDNNVLIESTCWTGLSELVARVSGETHDHHPSAGEPHDEDDR